MRKKDFNIKIAFANNYRKLNKDELNLIKGGMSYIEKINKTLKQLLNSF